MFTLRHAICDRLKEIGEERRALAEERRQLLDRLQQLEQQTSGIDASSVIGTMNETVRALSELVPQVPATVLIEEVAKKMEHSKISVEVTKGENETHKAVKEAAKEEHITRKIEKKRNYSSKEVAKIIVAYLREHGGHARNKEIEKYLQDNYDLRYKDFSQTMWLIRQNEPRLRKGRQGFSELVESA